MVDEQELDSRITPIDGLHDRWRAAWPCPSCGAELVLGMIGSKSAAVRLSGAFARGEINLLCGKCSVAHPTDLLANTRLEGSQPDPEMMSAWGLSAQGRMLQMTQSWLDTLCRAVLDGKSIDEIDSLVGRAMDAGVALRGSGRGAEPTAADIAGAIDLNALQSTGEDFDCATCGNEGECEREESCSGWFPKDGEEPGDTEEPRTGLESSVPRDQPTPHGGESSDVE